MNKCGNCGDESPAGGTEIVVVRGLRKQLVWVEFCDPCGDKWVITTVNGKTYTAKELMEHSSGEKIVRSNDEVDQLQRQLYGKARHEHTPFN